MRKSRTPAERNHLRNLRTAFQSAFREWASQVTTFHTGRRHADVNQEAMEAAHSAYQRSRNELADFMLARPADCRKAS